MKKVYELTDGIEVFEVQEMTEEEAALQNTVAEVSSDGNLWWKVKE
jgi:hypothetical protein